MVVHHHGGGVEALGRLERDVEVLREDAGLERDRQRVRGRDGLVQVRVAVDAGHRPEHFLAGDAASRGGSSRTAGLSVVCRQALAADRTCRPARGRLLDPGRDPVRLTRLDQRSDLRLERQRVADAQRTRRAS